MQLPPQWQFLGSMWWVLHVIAIILVFFLGYVVGKASGERDDPGASGWKSDAGNKSEDDSSAGKPETP